MVLLNEYFFCRRLSTRRTDWRDQGIRTLLEREERGARRSRAGERGGGRENHSVVNDMAAEVDCQLRTRVLEGWWAVVGEISPSPPPKVHSGALEG